MVIGLLRRLIVVLTAAAFLGGATVQAMPPSGHGAAPAADTSIAADDCASMAMHLTHTREMPQPMPCKGVTPDCIKATGCIGLPSLPTPVGQVAEPIEYGRITYVSELSRRNGIST